MNRNTPQDRATKVSCPNPSCEGVLYELQPGEMLARSAQPGRIRVEKTCECPSCGLGRSLFVQVRAS